MIKIAGALVGIALLAGCGGGSDSNAAPIAAASQASTPADGGASQGDRAAALKKAIQGYTDALLRGQLAGAVGYLDPRACGDSDEGRLALTVGQIKDVAAGASMTITSVKIDGDRGGVQDYALPADAPDQLRRLAKASMTESGRHAWRFHGGEWYLAGPCEDESASPAATPS